MKKLILYITAPTLIIFLCFMYVLFNHQANNTPTILKLAPTTNPTNTPNPTIHPSIPPTPVPSIIIQEVPFTPQAPFAQWDQPIFQYACEEASVIMAMAWVNNYQLTQQTSQDQIETLSNYAQSTIGTWKDESATDTLDLIKNYYSHQNILLFKNTNSQEIINALYDNSIAIVPLNGRLLGNPYYTPPGPIQHMLVVTGYDPKTDEFITNDPGTRFGKSYRYKTVVFENAMQDYPTGDHEPILNIEKNAIIIGK